MCDDGEWVIEPPSGDEVTINTTVSAPVRITGNLTISNRSTIRFRVTNSSVPLIIVDGDLALGIVTFMSMVTVVRKKIAHETAHRHLAGRW